LAASAAAPGNLDPAHKTVTSPNGFAAVSAFTCGIQTIHHSQLQQEQPFKQPYFFEFRSTHQLNQP
jgi:hypothetical protein